MKERRASICHTLTHAQCASTPLPPAGEVISPARLNQSRQPLQAHNRPLLPSDLDIKLAARLHLWLTSAYSAAEITGVYLAALFGAARLRLAKLTASPRA